MPQGLGVRRKEEPEDLLDRGLRDKKCLFINYSCFILKHTTASERAPAV